MQVIANNKYPYLKKFRKEKISTKDRKEIMSNVEASFAHRIGDVAGRGTASILISSFVSVIAAGQYSNYIMITSSVGMIVNIVFTSVTASIGNLCVNGSDEEQYSVYKNIRYLAYFCGTFTFVCYVSLFSSFIEIWVGKDMVMPLAVTVAISFDSSKWYFRKAILTFKDAKGMFKIDWYKPLLEAVAGIGLGIGLSYIWGTLGVILGHIIATLVIAIPIETCVFFKKGIKKPLLPQFASWCIAFVFAFGLAALTYYIASFIPSGIGWFILRFFFVVIFAAGAFILATCWTPEFKYYKSLAGRIFKAMFAKIKNLLHRGKKAVPAEGQESQDVVEGGAESVDSAESLPCAEERESGGDKSGEGK